MNSTYIDQANRTVRSFKKIPQPNYPNSTPEEVWDAYYHFLQDAYHLKDWIINDNKSIEGFDSKQKKKLINDFIEGNINMKLLQAVVANIKHLKADHKHINFKEIALTWSGGGIRSSPEITYSDVNPCI